MTDDPAVARATADDLPARIIADLAARRLTIAVAESLTGGLLVAELISVPGASAVVLGGVVAYNTELKHTLLGVDATLLAAHGPVHPDVAMQMAAGVRKTLAVAGAAADVGIATTGVAGPVPQGGQPPGVVFIAIAVGSDVRTVGLRLFGSRDQIRRRVVDESLRQLSERLEIR